MTAVLLTAIRELSGTYKRINESKHFDPKLKLQASVLEMQVLSELQKLPPPQSLVGSENGIQKSALTENHRPLTLSNSVAGIASGTSSLVNSSRFPIKDHRKLDRSMSEPVQKSSGASQFQRPITSNLSRYKTELCRPFEENGSCKYGEKCQFAHGAPELRLLDRHPKYKTELCRTFHTSGLCPYGPRCHFIHNDLHRSHFAAAGYLANNMKYPSGQICSNHMPLKELDICGLSIGSAGDISPNSSSVSGSPTFSNHFTEDHFSVGASVSSLQAPNTAPPVMSPSAVFFNGQESIPYSKATSLPVSSVVKQTNLLQAVSPNDRFAGHVELMEAQMNEMHLSDNGNGSAINGPGNMSGRPNVAGDRLPIFNRLAFRGVH